MQAFLRRRAGRAFTLIELMVVIVILGILATLIMPKILDRPEQARRTKAKAQIRLFQTALQLFKADTGRYPTASEGLDTLVADPGVKDWHKGGYLQDTDKVPADPWGNKYVYSCPGKHSDFDIVTYGADGQPGGADNDADIESWNLDAR